MLRVNVDYIAGIIFWFELILPHFQINVKFSFCKFSFFGSQNVYITTRCILSEELLYWQNKFTVRLKEKSISHTFWTYSLTTHWEFTGSDQLSAFYCLFGLTQNRTSILYLTLKYEGKRFIFHMLPRLGPFVVTLNFFHIFFYQRLGWRIFGSWKCPTLAPLNYLKVFIINGRN